MDDSQEPTPTTPPHLPEAILLMGIQATGKSSFFKERFFRTHVRINLDMLRTRFREELLVSACLAGRTSFVVDNTNVTADERARYLRPAQAAGFRVEGYYFESKLSAALARNALRTGDARIPDRGLFGAAKRLELPNKEEGFDRLWYVQLGVDGSFLVQEWRDEI